MPETVLGEESVSYEVRSSSRARHPRIDVDLSGVTVVVPDGMDLDPETFLTEKKEWVLEKNAEMAPYREEMPDRRFADGETLPFQGVDHTIRVAETEDHTIRDGRIVLDADAVERNSVEDELRDVLREAAREQIHDVIDRYAPLIDGEPNNVYIKNQKTRWGSCSSKNNLNFNWRLILAPSHILEYVVVHELVHLEHPDHSDTFWDRLTTLCPHARESREWLEENAHRLIFTEDDLP